MTGTRIDKWLWAARFFKTRALASKACDLNRVQSNGHPAKSAREVRLNDMLHINSEAGVFEVEVLVLSEVRGPGALAQTYFRETETSKQLREQTAAARKAQSPLDRAFNIAPANRPSKRDRRLIHRFRND